MDRFLRNSLAFGLIFGFMYWAGREILKKIEPQEDWTVSLGNCSTPDDVFMKTAQIRYRYSTHWPTPTEVLSTMTGDCKGAAILAVQMLRQLGHDAEFALVRTDLSNPVYDHALVYMRGNLFEPRRVGGVVPTNLKIVAIEKWTYQRLTKRVTFSRRFGN